MSQNVKAYIAQKRPSLSKSSLTTYASILRNLYKRVFKDEDYQLDKFDNSKPVLAYLADVPPNRRKTILSALVIITDKKEYRDLMLSDVRDYNKDINKQEKTPAQEASWVSKDDINTIYKELKQNADLIYKKKNKTIADLQQIQNFIIMAVLGSVFIPPRRSKDYVDFKIKNIDKDKDNFMEKNKFIFTSYKTSKTYGKQEVTIPVQLRNIIKKWSGLNPTEHLLFDGNLNKLSAVKLNQRLNKIFGGKKVGVNQLRHTYLTDKYAATIEQKKQIKEDMQEMGSSSAMLDTYVKEE
tara:strand:+ start:144 stop:1031 length:888 start_codon:yes stop_codon:yes gene_type:complete